MFKYKTKAVVSILVLGLMQTSLFAMKEAAAIHDLLRMIELITKDDVITKEEDRNNIYLAIAMEKKEYQKNMTPIEIYLKKDEDKRIWSEHSYNSIREKIARGEFDYLEIRNSFLSKLPTLSEDHARNIRAFISHLDAELLATALQVADQGAKNVEDEKLSS